MAIANIAVNDREATPVAHTFVPIADGPTAQFANSTGATTRGGQELLTVEVLRGKSDAASDTARVQLIDPVEAVVDGNTVVVRKNNVRLYCTFGPGATIQEKKNSLRMVANAIMDANVEGAIVNGIPFI